jgi:hypothetical protein
MKLSSLLVEAEAHRKDLTEGKFLELLKEKCKNSHIVATKSPFFRQDKGADLQLITPSMREEKSSFWIDKMIREIPAWKRYPDRARCIKAYTRYGKTHEGDDVYVLIPFDGAKIGIAQNESFYRSFKAIENSLGFDRIDNKAFREWLETLFSGLSEITKEKIEMPKIETFAQLKKAFLKIDSVLEKDRSILKKNLSGSDKLSDEQAKMIKDLLSRHIVDMEKYLEEKLDPEVNGFGCVRIESFSAGRAELEIWVDSPCLLVKRTKYIELHKQGSL